MLPELPKIPRPQKWIQKPIQKAWHTSRLLPNTQVRAICPPNAIPKNQRRTTTMEWVPLPRFPHPPPPVSFPSLPYSHTLSDFLEKEMCKDPTEIKCKSSFTGVYNPNDEGGHLISHPRSYADVARGH